MTVLDLIKSLAAMPMDARVWVRDASHTYEMALRDEVSNDDCDFVWLTLMETSRDIAAEVAIRHPSEAVAPCEYCGEPQHSMTARDVATLVKDALLLRGVDAVIADERARNIAAMLQGSTIR